MLKRIMESSRLEIFIAVTIALASATTALVTWRASMANSAAGDAIRQGLIDAVKKQASSNENWRQTYEEAGYTQVYAATLAQVEAYEASRDAIGEAQAKNLRQYLLPNLQLLSQPLGTDAKYLMSDGRYDLDLRFADLQTQAADISTLDPEASFKLSDGYAAEQRWLTVDIILLAITLFWLALAELNTGRSRLIMLGIGLGLYLVSIAWFGAVEIVFLITRGGAL
ncbi:MAG: hypothetical protein QY332_12175 [Anaerolineales bacterium]|nr:MAG: hypothetical protein QY332_12175 [Anaerolineales bacterium]